MHFFSSKSLRTPGTLTCPGSLALLLLLRR
jgi:hypothetical protein